LKIGASVGLTPLGRGETDIDGIISRADNACYEAKAAGRGRVTVVAAPDISDSSAAIARAS
jgi:predicted signal transduction protein with EAL and GGDEF domain